MEDVLYRFLSLYKKSPAWVKRTVGTCYGVLPYSVRYGDNYQKFTRLAEESRFLTKDQHAGFQYKKTKSLLIHAYKHIPFYKEHFDKNGVEPDDFKSMHDLVKFPLVTREQIKQCKNDFIAQNISKSQQLYTSTSGSSGVPLEIFHQKGVTRPKERAFLHDLFGDFGFKKGQKTVVFRGEVINDDDPWYYEPVDKNLIMSSYLLSDNTVKKYVEKINKFKPSVIRGYPFMVHKLVQLMKQHNIKPLNLKCVILESENIYDNHRSDIENYFSCSVCHYYGHTERLVFGGNCKMSDEYHIHPEYGVIEIVDAQGIPVNEGEEGEIIATGFDNDVMPLIRYRTQDFAIKGSNSCRCGRNFPMLKKIMGRAEDYVILNDGSKIPFHNLLAGIHGDTWGKVYKLQCVQDTPGILAIKIMPGENIDGDESIEVFTKEIRKRVDENLLNIYGEIVLKIPVTPSGKTKLFIQNIGKLKQKIQG